MIKDPDFKRLLNLFHEIKDIVLAKKWRDASEARLKILISKKLDHLKWELGNMPEDKLVSSEESAVFIETVLELINDILMNIPKDNLPVAYYELELFRLRYASMYALSYGKGGELQVAGAAHALANALMGISTLDVDGLFVEWDHPEFMKRKKLILNYLSSAFLFFFSICDSLNLVYKQDLEYWLTEGINASIQYYKAVEKLWDVPLTIAYQRNYPGPKNYSHYTATYAMFNVIISFLLEFQRFFFDGRINLPDFGNFIDLSSHENFFDSLYKLMAKAEYYIEDLKKHVEKGSFDLNENPLEDPEVKQAIEGLMLTKAIIRGEHALYRAVVENNLSELNIIDTSVLPAIFDYIGKYKHLMEREEFMNSGMADSFNSIIEGILFYAAFYALKTKNTHYIEELEKDYHMFFTEAIMARYPRLNGFYTVIKLTLDIENGKFDNIEYYAERLEKLSEYSVFEPRNAFSFLLLSKLIQLRLGKITGEELLKILNKVHEQFYMSFTPSLNNEIEIYKQNIEVAINFQEPSFNMKRLTDIKHYDPYSLFVPDISKIPTDVISPDIIYLPFNLAQDYIAEKPDSEKPLGQMVIVDEQTK